MTPYEQALADIRAIPVSDHSGQRSAPACCSGDRNGYQWHLNHQSTPCGKSREANRLWHASYRARRAERRVA